MGTLSTYALQSEGSYFKEGVCQEGGARAKSVQVGCWGQNLSRDPQIALNHSLVPRLHFLSEGNERAFGNETICTSSVS